MNNKMKFDLIVIGGGPAGVTAALRGRELGVSVALVERNRLGGTCTNDGCVPTRVLAKTARLLRDAEQFEVFGLTGIHPELNFERLMMRTQQVVYQIHEKKQLIEHLANSGVRVFHEVGSAQFTDPHTISLPDGKELQADKFILCAGGRARRLDFPGAEHAYTHSDLWTLKKVPESIIIVGGAATGCQLASIFEAFGSKVTIFEISDRILRAEDEFVSTTISESFQERGVQIITGFSSIDRIQTDADGLLFYYKLNEQLKSLKAEAIILSAGWVGNLSSLNLSAADIETIGHYIKVNEYMQTSAPHIFAAGDINGKMMLVQSAGMEAIIAAENAVLGAGQPIKHVIVPHGGFTDPEYGSVGLTEEQAVQNHECVSALVPYSELDRACIDDHTAGGCKLIVSRETHRILGAHVVGEQALEVVQLIAAGMAVDMWVEQLAELEIAYPTFTAILGLAARRIVNELGVRPLAAEWRSLRRLHAAEWER